MEMVAMSAITDITSPKGNLFLTEYKSKIDEFKADFDSSMRVFDRSVAVETFKAVTNIGEYNLHWFTATRAEGHLTMLFW